MKPQNKPLSVSVHKGVMRIEIGVDTLASAYLRSEHAWRVANPNANGNLLPEDIFRIKNKSGFARDVKREMLDEAEDGSNLLNMMLDKAAAGAVEQGSIYFVTDEEEAK